MKKEYILIVLLILCFAFSIASVPTSPDFTVENALNVPMFVGKAPLYPKWSADKARMYYVEASQNPDDGGLYVFDAETGRKSIVLSLKTLEDSLQKSGKRDTVIPVVKKFPSYRVSPDGNSLLLTLRGARYVYNPTRKKLVRLNIQDDVMGVQLSPDGKRLALSTGKSISIFNLKTFKTRKIAKTVDPNVLIGLPDWLYEEELDVESGLFWSPDGQKIAFFSFNEDGVPTYPIVDETVKTPKVDVQFYPKPGEQNPSVSLYLADLASGKTTEIPDAFSGTGYLPRVTWLPDSSGLVFQLLNRRQTRLTANVFNITNNRSRSLFEETSDQWINVPAGPRFLKDGTHFLIISEADGFSHLYKRSLKGDPQIQLTKGSWVVDELLGVDEDNEVAYVSGNRDNPIGRDVYRVKLDGTGLSRVSTNDFPWHDAIFSTNGKYFLDEYSDAYAPRGASIVSTDSGKSIKFAGDSTAKSKSVGFVKPEFVTIKASDGTDLHAMILKPVDFKEGKRYPVVVEVYGGPGLQLVEDRWIARWSPIDQLFSQHGFVYFSIDNRGSARRGKKFEGAISGEFGKHELEDQLAGVEYLKKKPYVDSERIGIWGWSYGGYMTLYTLTHSDEFSCGFSVAPVVDWLYYDSCYTERYMKFPKDNMDGYRKSSPINFVSELNVPLTVAQGLVDNNVHFQNSATFLDAAYKAGKHVDMAYYPRMSHGIRGKESRLDLFKRIINFFEENLKKDRER